VRRDEKTLARKRFDSQARQAKAILATNLSVEIPSSPIGEHM
jgi:hypothetical protein